MPNSQHSELGRKQSKKCLAEMRQKLVEIGTGYRSDGPMRDGRSSLLAITSELPWPLNTGGHLRTYHLLRSLARRFRVRLVTSISAANSRGARELAACGLELRTAVLPAKRRTHEVIKAGRAALVGEPYVLFRRHDHPQVRKLLRDELRREMPDIVYLDHLDPLVYLNEFPASPVAMDLHNVYSRLTARVSEEHHSWPVRRYLRRESRLLEAMERQASRAARVLFAVSEEEQHFFQSLGTKACFLVPNGVDCGRYKELPIGRANHAMTILYVGALSWPPNARAAEFLAREIFPAVRSRLAAARLQIVGRDPLPQVTALRGLPGVEVLANVPDVRPFLGSARVMAVPLDSGGGTRLKILEAFAAGLPVVSTAVGCEGLRVVHGDHLLIAERSAMADALVTALCDRELTERLAMRARRAVEDVYDWNAIGRSACQALTSVLPNRSQFAE